MSKLILKPVLPSSVSTPSAGYTAVYLSSVDGHYWMKFSNGLEEKLAFESDLNAAVSQEIFMENTFSQFPLVGNPLFLYIAKDTNFMYRWDTFTMGYQLVTTTVTIIVYSRNKYSTRFDENINVGTVDEALDAILFPYVEPLASLVGTPGSQVREIGDPLSGITLTATATRKSDDIVSVQYFKNAVMIYNVVSPNINTDTYNHIIGTPITSNSDYTVKVGDGSAIIESDPISIEFVAPYCYGEDAAGLTEAQIFSLTKLVEKQSDKTVEFNPNTEVMYFAFPTSYPALTSIKDQNGFETISDWDYQIKSFTLLDSSVQNYRVYEFKNIVELSNFKYTFKH